MLFHALRVLKSLSFTRLTGRMAEQDKLKRPVDEGIQPDSLPTKVPKSEGENDVAKARLKYNKYAMFVSFCGQGYHGMQINGNIPTIERELLTALAKCGLIENEDCSNPGGKISFQRAVRTDKNVSAVKQICSLKLPRSLHEELNSRLVTELNRLLPERIRIWGFTRVTQGFNAKNSCDNRTYCYLLPSVAFAPIENVSSYSNAQVCNSFRLSDDQHKKANELLAMFKGTLNFYNFTSGKKPDDRSCIRYIISCTCGEPFVVNDVEFVRVTIRGQSFMVHQIRKIIGLTIAVLHGYADMSIVQKSLSNANTVDVPKAPGLGLALHEVHYDSYNRRYEKTHEQLSWDKYQERVTEFCRRHIEMSVVETEIQEKSMVVWLDVLKKHSFSNPERNTVESEAKDACARPPILRVLHRSTWQSEKELICT